jgi:hypothetical protein
MISSSRQRDLPLVCLLVICTTIVGRGQTGTTTKPKSPSNTPAHPIAIQAAPLSPLDAAMKSLATLLTNTHASGTYVGKDGAGGQESISYEQVSAVGCVLTYTKITDWHNIKNETDHTVSTRSLDLKQAVLVQGTPNGWKGRDAAFFDMSRSAPDYEVAVKFLTPQPLSAVTTITDAAGKVTEKPDAAPANTAAVKATTLDEATNLQQALNQAILLCGGAANVAPPEPVAPPPPPKPAPRPSACSAEGPDLATTAKYIVDNSKRTASIEVSSADGQLYEYEDNNQKERFIIDYMSLDCRDIEVNTSTDGELGVWLTCRDGVSCIQWTWWCVLYGQDPYWREYTHVPHAHSFVTQSGDPELTRNLQRALMHYIFLLQQDFRNRHTDPNDPFAKPH